MTPPRTLAPGTITEPPAPRQRRAAVLLGVSLGYCMVLLDLTVMSVAEPDLAASLGASTSGLQWVTTAYTVLFAALLLFALPALVSAIVAEAPVGTAGSAGGILNAVRQVGATLGVACMGAPAGVNPAPGAAGAALMVSAAVCGAAGISFARRRGRDG